MLTSANANSNMPTSPNNTLECYTHTVYSFEIDDIVCPYAHNAHNVILVILSFVISQKSNVKSTLQTADKQRRR